MGTIAQGITSQIAHKINQLEKQDKNLNQEEIHLLREKKLEIEKKNYETFDSSYILYKKLTNPFGNFSVPKINDLLFYKPVMKSILPEYPKFKIPIIELILTIISIITVIIAPKFFYIPIIIVLCILLSLYIKYDKYKKDYSKADLLRKDLINNEEKREILVNENNTKIQNALINSEKGDINSIDFLINKYFKKIDFFDKQMPIFFDYDVVSSETIYVECDLPEFEFIPETWIKKSDNGTTKIIERNKTDSNKMHSTLICTIPLMFCSYIFTNFPTIKNIIFSGYMDILNKATGHYERKYYISSKIRKDIFENLILERIDPISAIMEFDTRFEITKYFVIKPIIPIIKDKKTDKVLYSVSYLKSIDPIQFERVTRDLFERMGYYTELTQSARDGGIDVIATDPSPIKGGKFIIQCKRYNNTVPVEMIRDLYGVMTSEKANKGILITTSDFSHDGYKFALDKPIELINGTKLEKLLKENFSLN